MWLVTEKPKTGGVEVVKCFTCSKLCDIKDTQSISYGHYEQKWYFCKEHTVHYEKAYDDGYYLDGRNRYIYCKSILVNQDGEPIGYEKVT